MNNDQLTEFHRLLSAECRKRPELKKFNAEISIGWNPSLPSELTLTVHWWDAEMRKQSIIYPPEDWKDGLSSLLDDLLARSILRKPPKPIPLPADR